MRTAIVAVALLAAVAGAHAFADFAAIRAVTKKAAVAKFNPQITLGNPCGSTSSATSCVPACGYGSSCTGNDQTSGVCQYLSVGKSCGDTCQPYNSTSGVYPSASQCPAGTVCDVTGATGTAYTCGFGARVGFAYINCGCTSSGNECRSPATCQNSVCSLSGRSALPTGASCVNGNDCSSGTCTSGACAARSPSCFSNNDCAVGKACNTTSGACVDPIPIGGACYLSASGQEQVDCAGGAGCLGANGAWGTCTAMFSQASGSKCYQNPAWCQPGLACDTTSATGVCSASGTCDQLYGAFTCPIGQYCGCSGTTAQCQGPTLSQSCADKYKNQASACYASARTIPAAPLNYQSGSISSGCVSAAADLFCDRSCSGPDAAFGGRSLFSFGNAIDYAMINCGSKSLVSYSSGQNLGCSRTYCPTGFNAASSTGASALVVAAAVVAAVLALRN